MKRKNLDKVVKVIDEMNQLENHIEYLRNELMSMNFVNHGKTGFGIPLWQEESILSRMAADFKDTLIDELNKQLVNLEKELEQL
jgi:uncharacterized coiled-coil protein SlyX